MSSYFFDGFYSSCICTFQILYIAGFGVFIKKMGFVDKTFQKSLSKVVSNISLPCFIFTQIIKSFQISQAKFILETMVGCFLQYIFGFIIGYCFMKLFGYSNKRAKFMGAFYSSPHTISIPLILLPNIGPILDRFIPMPQGFRETAEFRGYLYIILNSIFSNIWRWSGVNYLIQPEEENEEKIPVKDEFNIKKFLKDVINMPIIASTLSILITLYPPAQQALNNPESFLNHSLFTVNQIIGKSYSFLVVLMLGFSLSDFITFHPDPEVVKKIIFKGYDIIWFSLFKLIAMPIICAPFMIWVSRYLLKADDAQLFIFFIMAASPSAINMILVCTLKGAYIETISMLMVAMYGLSMITLTAATPVIIYILSSLPPLTV